MARPRHTGRATVTSANGNGAALASCSSVTLSVTTAADLHGEILDEGRATGAGTVRVTVPAP